jgi:hypothetical protein
MPLRSSGPPFTCQETNRSQHQGPLGPAFIGTSDALVGMLLQTTASFGAKSVRLLQFSASSRRRGEQIVRFARSNILFYDEQYPILRRARKRLVLSDLRAVSNGLKIQKQRKSRTAIRPRNIDHKTSHETQSALNRHLAKPLETKDFSLVGAPGLEPGTR